MTPCKSCGLLGGMKSAAGLCSYCGRPFAGAGPPAAPEPTKTNYAHYPEFAWYLASVKKAFAVTAAGGRIQMFWNTPPLDAAGWRAEFLGALEKRLTLRMPNHATGRKTTGQYQLELARDADRLRAWRERRVRFYQIATPELRDRFEHLIARRDD